MELNHASPCQNSCKDQVVTATFFEALVSSVYLYWNHKVGTILTLSQSSSGDQAREQLRADASLSHDPQQYLTGPKKNLFNAGFQKLDSQLTS